MAVIRKRVDDYLFNSKGEENQDAKSSTISIPGLAFGGTRAQKHVLDLSDRGEKAMLREREKLEIQTRKLWAEFLKNVGFNPTKGEKSGSKTDDVEDEENMSENDGSGSAFSSSMTTEELDAAMGNDGKSADSGTDFAKVMSDEELEAATNPESDSDQ